MCAKSTFKPRTRMKKQSAMTEAISTKPTRFKVHSDRLKRTPDQQEGMERSMFTFTGEDRMGLNYRITSYLNEREINVRSGVERRHDDDNTLGVQYVIEGTRDAMQKIEPIKLEKLGEELDPVPTSTTLNYQLTVITPDTKGLLAKIGETLLKRKIMILSSDTITFTAPVSADLGGSGAETRVASISMVLGIQQESHEEILEDLKDGLEYLEHRYRWYIRLEKQPNRKPKAEQREEPELSILDIKDRHFQFLN